MQLEQARAFAALALACLAREYPNKLDHVLHGDADARSPRELHSAFYGCLDWHSAVHGHWMLARLAHRFELPEIAAIHALFDAHLTPANIAVEVAYFRQPLRQSFERMYGWAWLLQLATELRGSRWASALQPLVDEIVARAIAFLPKQAYPVRTGVHANTAFALGLMLDHGDARLDALVRERALAYYAHDADAPAHWEPSGEDFLSPVLVEAELMTRVLPAPQFASWFAALLPRGLPRSIATPVDITDRSDPKLAHLDGLNLSRAWCLRAIAAALPAEHALAASCHAAADAHARAGLAHVTTGDYAGEHWLATFAVYLLTR